MKGGETSVILSERARGGILPFIDRKENGSVCLNFKLGDGILHNRREEKANSCGERAEEQFSVNGGTKPTVAGDLCYPSNSLSKTATELHVTRRSPRRRRSGALKKKKKKKTQ